MARSESNAVPSKIFYPELNLTNYPDIVDTSTNNNNMKGYENLKDYNYAEHINALADAVMAIQKVLGITPFLDKDGVDRTTVNNRMAVIEAKDYDPRYGGVGWDPSQTLIGHTHTGGTGHPAQVKLDTEVQGILPKSQLNFLYDSGGITGADLSLSNTDARRIPDVVNDKLSASQGGTIQRNLEVKGQMQSRLYKEWDALNMAGSLITDYTSMTNQISRGSGVGQVQFLNNAVNNLHYGKYVLAVRARVSSLVTENVLELRWYDYLSNAWALNTSLYLKGTDFNAVNEWQMFYLTFDHTGNAVNSYGVFHVWKPTTTTAVLNVDVDCVYIMPTHPAVYDR
jgi:hypothetical protein